MCVPLVVHVTMNVDLPLGTILFKVKANVENGSNQGRWCAFSAHP
jgi:hypothetical protein